MILLSNVLEIFVSINRNGENRRKEEQASSKIGLQSLPRQLRQGECFCHVCFNICEELQGRWIGCCTVNSIHYSTIILSIIQYLCNHRVSVVAGAAFMQRWHYLYQLGHPLDFVVDQLWSSIVVVLWHCICRNILYLDTCHKV